MSLVRTRRGGKTGFAVLSIAVAAALLGACHGGSTAAPAANTAKTASTTIAPKATTAAAPSASPSTTTNTTVVPPASQPSTTATFTAITGTYYGGTADQGWLYIRADGASRYRYPDENACQCSTATAPIATIDFSLTNLTATAADQGHYRSTGLITAQSDPTTGTQLAGPTGSPVTVTIDPRGSATVSFLPTQDVLTIAAASSTPPAAVVAENLTVTSEVRGQLLQAATKDIGFPESDYLLTPGATFYALDTQTNSYWASSSLSLTSAAPAAAGVPLQDAGSNLLFTRATGGPWTVQDDGAAGESCPSIPSAVLAVWGWGPGTCRPVA